MSATEPCIVFYWADCRDRDCPREEFRFDSREDAEAFLEGRGMSHQIGSVWLGKGSSASLLTVEEWESRPVWDML